MVKGQFPRCVSVFYLHSYNGHSHRARCGVAGFAIRQTLVQQKVHITYIFGHYLAFAEIRLAALSAHATQLYVFKQGKLILS